MNSSKRRWLLAHRLGHVRREEETKERKKEGKQRVDIFFLSQCIALFKERKKKRTASVAKGGGKSSPRFLYMMRAHFLFSPVF